MARKKRRKSAESSRLLALVRLLGSLGVVGCFFLPWLQFSCSDTVFAQASGKDLLEGRLQLGAPSDERWRGFETVFQASDVPQETALWVWVAVMGLLVLSGAVGAVYGARFWSGLHAGAATLGLLLALWFYVAGFRVEQEFEARREQGAALGSTNQPALDLQPRVRHEIGFHASAVLLGLLVVAGIADGSRR